MSRFITISAIAACYFLFAILLNSVGTVILQSTTSFEVSKVAASTLEGFKDLPIAIVSFFVAAFLPRVGYKVALLLGLSLVTITCLLTPIIAQFWVLKLLFASIGVAFALVKVSVYAIIGQLSKGSAAHSSLLNTVEGIFMLGSLAGYWIFSLFLGDEQSLSWLHVYYLLALMCAVTIVLVMLSQIPKEQITKQIPKEQITQQIPKEQIDSHKNAAIDDFIDMLKMSYQPLVMIFILSIFLYVLIEQSIGTWLPTFNREILLLPVDISVQMTSFFAASLAVGRLLAGQILRYVPWYPFLNTAIALMAVLIIITLPLTKDVDGSAATGLFDVPMVAYLLPLIGLLMAPIYPLLNSIMLSSLATHKQAAMTGLIVVFSALGGTFGSMITGAIFEYLGGHQAFYFSLIPMAGIFTALLFFKRMCDKQNKELSR